MNVVEEILEKVLNCQKQYGEESFVPLVKDVYSNIISKNIFNVVAGAPVEQFTNKKINFCKVESSSWPAEELDKIMHNIHVVEFENSIIHDVLHHIIEHEGVLRMGTPKNNSPYECLEAMTSHFDWMITSPHVISGLHNCESFFFYERPYANGYVGDIKCIGTTDNCRIYSDALFPKNKVLFGNKNAIFHRTFVPLKEVDGDRCSWFRNDLIDPNGFFYVDISQ